MRKALFIAYYFPPCSEIGGSIRSEKFIKYLPRFGWQTRIVSLSNPRFRIDMKEKYPGVQRPSSLIPFNRPYKLELYGWLVPMYHHALKIIKNDNYDLIYVSCPPFPTSAVAARIKRLAGIPLVVDYRDAWTLGYYKSSSRMGKIISRLLFPWMERNVLSDVEGLIVNTPSALNCYLEAFPSLNGRITMIPNGYDEEDFIEYRSHQKQNEMILLHCGRFGVAGRDPIHLLEAVKLLKNEQLRIRLNIIGDHGASFAERIVKLGLSQFVQLIGQIPHQAAIQAMGKSDVLVIYQEQYETPISPIAGKTYEYLRTGRPILAITPAGDNLDLIRQYSCRYETAPPYDTTAIAQAIYTLYKQWQQGLLKEYASPQKDYFERFNREALTARLADYFNQVIT